MNTPLAHEIARIVCRALFRIIMMAIVLVAMITALCCFDPDAVGMKCDHPGLFMASASIGVAALAALFAIPSKR